MQMKTEKSLKLCTHTDVLNNISLSTREGRVIDHEEERAEEQARLWCGVTDRPKARLHRHIITDFKWTGKGKTTGGRNQDMREENTHILYIFCFVITSEDDSSEWPNSWTEAWVVKYILEISRCWKRPKIMKERETDVSYYRERQREKNVGEEMAATE